MKTYLAPIGSGLGDVIVALPILRWLLDNTNGQVCLVARSERQLGLTRRIKGLAATVREPDLPSLIEADDKLINLRDHPMQRCWDWSSDKFRTHFPGYNIDKIQRDICADFGVFPDFTNQPRLLNENFPATKGKLLLIPGTTGEQKSWPVWAWHSLYQRLSKTGIQCLLVGEPDRSPVVKELVSLGIALLPTPNIETAIDAISNCMFVISVDTGLMHLAAQQGISTVALYGNYDIYWRSFPNCHAVFAPRCAPECLPQSLSDEPNFCTTYEWGWHQPGGSFLCKALQKHCMSQISVEEVFRMAIKPLELTASQ